MAHVPNFVLTVQVDEEKATQLVDAQERFRLAAAEMEAATEGVRAAIRGIRDSLTLTREVDNGPQDPGLERSDGQA